MTFPDRPRRSRWRPTLVLAIAIAAAAVGGVFIAWRGNPWYGPKARVRKAWADFSAAIVARDGDAVIDAVTRRSIAFYERCRKDALDPSALDVATASQMEVMIAMECRYRLDRATLESMDGRDLISWGVQGLGVTEESAANIELVNINCQGSRAAAELREKGNSDSVSVEFALEDGRWRFDMVSLLSSFEPRFERLRKNGAWKSKMDFAIEHLERKYGRPVPPEIREGPLR